MTFNKNNSLFPGLSILLLLIALSSCSTPKEEWQSLFNGKDLDGWEVKSSDGNTAFWTVEDGILIANSLGHRDHDYNWLQNKGEYEDFELKLKFQVFPDAKGNAGVQFRSRWDPTAETQWTDSTATGWMDGPQADLHPSGPWRSGQIYDETRGHQRWISPSLENWELSPSI